MTDTFFHPDGAELTITYEGSSNTAIADATLEGNILTVTAGNEMGIATISVKAVAADESSSQTIDSFDVTVMSPNLITVEYTVEDSPEQGLYPNNPNTYANSLTEFGWVEIAVEENEIVANVHISCDWESVDYASEGSLELLSPSGSIYQIYSSTSTDLSHLELDVIAAGGETMNGTWSLYMIDSYGDGGHQITNCTVSFIYEGLATTGNITGNVTLSGDGDVTECIISAGEITTSPNANGDYFLTLEPGNYIVSATLANYVDFEATDIVVTLSEDTTLDFEMVEILENDIELSFVNELKGNFPNPFNPTTTISYSLANDANVIIDIYNSKGQKINTLVNEFATAGSHSVVWNGEDAKGQNITSGVYFYKIRSGKFTSTKKMILLK